MLIEISKHKEDTNIYFMKVLLPEAEYYQSISGNLLEKQKIRWLQKTTNYLPVTSGWF